MNQLLCVSSGTIATTPKANLKWLNDLCEDYKDIANMVLNTPAPNTKGGSIILRDTKRNLLAVSKFGDKKTLAIEVLKHYCQTSGSGHICESNGYVKEAVLEKAVEYLELIAKNFKWSDFIPSHEDLVKLAQSITWDGSDWGPLLKFYSKPLPESYKSFMDAIFTLQSYLHDRKEDGKVELEKFKAQLQSLKEKLVKNLEDAIEANKDDIVQRIKATDSVIESFSDDLRECINAYSIARAKAKLSHKRSVFGSLWNHQMTTHFESQFFKAGTWPRDVPLQEVFKISRPKLDPKVQELMSLILMKCDEFPFKCQGLSLPRYSLLATNWNLFHNVLFPNHEALLERLLFFFKNHKLFCGWSGDEYNQAAEISESDVKKFAVALSAARDKFRGPMELLPKDFFPVLNLDRHDQYTKLSNGLCNECIQKKLLNKEKWNEFRKAFEADEECRKLVEDTEKHLEESIKNMGWKNEHDLYGNDAKLREFEIRFVENAEWCMENYQSPKPVKVETGQSDIRVEEKHTQLKKIEKRQEPSKKALGRDDAVHGTIKQQSTTRRASGLFQSVNWLKVALVTIVLGLALLFAAAIIQHYHSQQHQLFD